MITDKIELSLETRRLPDRPGQIVALDIFHPEKDSYKVTMDRCSDFFEIDLQRAKTTSEITDKVWINFRLHGIPLQLGLVIATGFPVQNYRSHQTDGALDHS